MWAPVCVCACVWACAPVCRRMHVSACVCVCACVRGCVCEHPCVCTCVQVCAHVYRYVGLCEGVGMWAPVCACVCAWTCVQACACECLYVGVCMRVPVCVCMCVHTCTCTCACTLRMSTLEVGSVWGGESSGEGVAEGTSLQTHPDLFSEVPFLYYCYSLLGYKKLLALADNPRSKVGAFSALALWSNSLRVFWGHAGAGKEQSDQISGEHRWAPLGWGLGLVWQCGSSGPPLSKTIWATEISENLKTHPQYINILHIYVHILTCSILRTLKQHIIWVIEHTSK